MATPAPEASGVLGGGVGPSGTGGDLIGALASLGIPAGKVAIASLLIITGGLLLRHAVRSAVLALPFLDPIVLVTLTRAVSWATVAALVATGVAIVVKPGATGALLAAAPIIILALMLRGPVRDIVAGLSLARCLDPSAPPVVDFGGPPLRLVRIGTSHSEFSAPDGAAVLVPNRRLGTASVRQAAKPDAPRLVRAAIRISLKCDAARAQQVLLAAARTVPEILATPPMSVLLTGIDTSGFDFTVEAYTAAATPAAVTGSDLRLALVRAVQLQGLELAHTQHDVHLRDLDSLKTAFALAMEERRRSQQRPQ